MHNNQMVDMYIQMSYAPNGSVSDGLEKSVL